MQTRPLDELAVLLERRLGGAIVRGVLDAVGKALGPDFDPRGAGASVRLFRELFPRLNVFVEPRELAVLESEVRELCGRWRAGAQADRVVLSQAAVLAVLVRYVPKTMARSVLDGAWSKYASGGRGRDAADRLVGEIMESLRVFCAQEQLSSLMVDLAELCVDASANE